MTLKEYIEKNNTNQSQIAKLVPCTSQWINQIVTGDMVPSYKMARRIEQVTDGKVSRKNWYPDD